MLPKVSVVIPTYNRATLLPEAIRSVMRQTVKGIEVIVCDDGSTDGTEEVVRNAFPEVRYLRLEHSGLPAKARNAGIDAASGELIAFLDSDDRWTPDKIERQLGALEGGVGLVCSNAWRVTPAHEEAGDPYLAEGQGRSGRAFADLVNDNFVITSTVLVRRGLLEEVKGFCELPETFGVEDYDLWLRLSLRADIAYLPEPLAFYLDQPGSVRSLSSRIAFCRSILFVLKRARAEAVAMGLLEEHEGALSERTWSVEKELLQGLYRGKRYGAVAMASASMLRRRPLHTTALLSYLMTHSR